MIGFNTIPSVKVRSSLHSEDQAMAVLAQCLPLQYRLTEAMKLTKQQKSAALKAHDLYWESYIKGDIDKLSALLDENYSQIGSVEEEVFFNKKDAVKFVFDTIDQVAGKLEMRNRTTTHEVFVNFIVIYELCDLYVLIENECSFYSRFRATSILQEKPDGWKIVHQHSSLPDSKAQEGENIAIEKISEENLQLRDAIKRRTIELEHKNRELEIEAALERVRASAMAMQKSEDLKTVVGVLYGQLRNLGFQWGAASIIIMDRDTGDMDWWMEGFGDGYVLPERYHVPFFDHSGHLQQLDLWRSGTSYAEIEISGQEKKNYDAFYFYQTDFLNAPEPTKQLMMQQESVLFSMAFIKYGALSWSPTPLSREQATILERFAKVFEQCYTRFLDLQKAEAQAREAQIEVALERVRSRTMAMQRSNELTDVAMLLFQQVKELGIKAWTTGFNVWQANNTAYIDYVTDPSGHFLEPYMVDLTSHPAFVMIREAKQRGDDFFVSFVEGEQIGEMYQLLNSFANKGQFQKILDSGFQFPTHQFNHIVFGAQVSLLFVTYEACPEGWDIFKRFGKVFEQTYTRFLDLQKAEAQARDAQIEAALERVRSHSMAMQKSNDLNEVIEILYQEMKKLDGQLDRAFIMSFDPKTLDSRWWMASGDGIQYQTGLLVKYHDFPPYVAIVKAWQKRSEKWTYTMKGKDKQNWDSHIFFNSELVKLPDIVKSNMISATITYMSASFQNFGCLLTGSYSVLGNDAFQLLFRFSKAFDQSYTRFLDLKNAEAQAREAQIQLALERVRARTMAMQHSEELADAAQVLYQQFGSLEIPTLVSGFIFIQEEKGIQRGWTVLPDGSIKKDFIDFPLTGDRVLDDRFKAWKKKVSLHRDLVAGKENKAHHDFLASHVPAEISTDIFAHLPDTIHFYSANFNFGYLHILRETPFNSEEEGIVIRFAKVFEQTYTRFLDLQKAEAQARESQIEAALERVRSHSMAMQKSNDLNEVIGILYQEMKKLDGQLDRAFIITIEPQSFDSRWWMASGDEIQYQTGLLVSNNNFPLYLGILNAWQKGEEKWTYTLEGKEKKDWDSFVFLNSELGKLPEMVKANMIDQLKTLCFATYQNFGCLLAASYGWLSEDAFQLLFRFSNAFDQAYTRFLDLQKAEAQARESQIEAALERVRARTMAMHISSELIETAELLFDQLKQLGAKSQGVAFAICDRENIMVQKWTSIGVFLVPYTFEAGEQRMYEAWKNQTEIYEEVYEGERLRKYYELFMEIPEFKQGIQKFIDSGYPLPDWQKNHAVPFKHGYLLLITTKPFEEIHIFTRFAKVFEQTYTRFLDLKKAEAQAQEAKIEVALERIRARALAMHSSTELSDVANVLREQMGILGQEDLEASVVHLYTAGSPTFDSWYAFRAGDKIIEGQTTFRLENSALAKEFLNLYVDDVTEYTIEVKGEKLKEWLAEIKRNAPKIAAYWGDLPPEKQFYHFSDFSGGALLMVSHENLSEETRMLQKRCAWVFELAYKRFLDLEAKERQDKELREEKQRLEKALSELKATQSQLIQSEKMASLGQLTAGIAHEIQNPLNFVNNFSEVSTELMEELKGERSKLKGERDEAAEEEIIEDVIQNLNKITLHGKRADAIVKGMLEHSRTSSGGKVSTDLNALAEEYLRLSYHGMRAKDKNFQADFETDFDPNLPKVNVVPQDIGRVLLNIINNAFYACSQPSKGSEPLEGFKPLFKLSTKNLGDTIEISIKDNGPGIPDAIKDKIFQPFFTTKPTGEGTGLGLSLSYDIVKAHGGELIVESEVGKGSTFSIFIPLENEEF